uniref:RBR-type E3 ubiquitin transferase n=1 Tax=Chromera velia CCMP2878 TaxID=1169474 RepID=A0A0G4FSM7_9ALVE|eukprot:Cvel_18414.t1-p1 / transcript=Cvel_18414.t1 / gene=Cvel_18414 / organism=Chromera_velia_CCMP2878 / gene_product=Uncharacterized protein DDB_G0292642, putative / transcript_product=Uncharacterized protein DDB_G0292642, putative / location=Cvel_scaffold1523:21535-26322(+) / protein_length=783 / sequence_SO=supercontig / SO=protein_coding / is_pseudo=false
MEVADSLSERGDGNDRPRRQEKNDADGGVSTLHVAAQLTPCQAAGDEQTPQSEVGERVNTETAGEGDGSEPACREVMPMSSADVCCCGGRLHVLSLPTETPGQTTRAQSIIEDALPPTLTTRVPLPTPSASTALQIQTAALEWRTSHNSANLPRSLSEPDFCLAQALQARLPQEAAPFRLPSRPHLSVRGDKSAFVPSSLSFAPPSSSSSSLASADSPGEAQSHPPVKAAGSGIRLPPSIALRASAPRPTMTEDMETGGGVLVAGGDAEEREKEEVVEIELDPSYKKAQEGALIFEPENPPGGRRGGKPTSSPLVLSRSPVGALSLSGVVAELTELSAVDEALLFVTGELSMPHSRQQAQADSLAIVPIEELDPDQMERGMGGASDMAEGTPRVASESRVAVSVGMGGREISSRVVCLICYDKFAPSEICTKLSCHKKHPFCTQCVSEFLRVQIEDGKVESLGCPMGFRCERLLSDVHIKELVSAQVYAKLERFRRRRRLSRDSRVIWCPSPDCEGYIKTPMLAAFCLSMMSCWRRPAVGARRGATLPLCCGSCIGGGGRNRTPEADCPVCKTSLCSLCGTPAHRGQPCPAPSPVELAEAGSDAGMGLGAYTREEGHVVQLCPRCGVRTEKTGGCNHITCTSCRLDWCWLCRREYSDIHYKPWNLFGCPGMQSIGLQPSGILTRLGMKAVLFIGLLLLLPFVLAFGFSVVFVQGSLERSRTLRRLVNRGSFVTAFFVTLGLWLLGLILTPLALPFALVFFCWEADRRRRLHRRRRPRPMILPL